MRSVSAGMATVSSPFPCARGTAEVRDNPIVVVIAEGTTWRWRIIAGAGELAEESTLGFPGLTEALAAGPGPAQSAAAS